MPVYIDELPVAGLWGHPYEFALNEDLLAPAVMSVRSPGRDGVFEGNRYFFGPFGLEEFDRDVVWADGYFIAWPSP